MKKVAILIPSYKPKEYLERCLLSLEKQTLPKNQFCVYICLNGPQQPYEKYILNILNEIDFTYKYLYINRIGVSNARNKLLDFSKEEFIAFVDDDDLVSENYLQNLLDVSTDKYIGIANIYYFRTDIKYLEKNYIGSDFRKLNNIEIVKVKTRRYFSSSCAKIIHRSMIGKTRFDINLKNGEDSLFMAMISKDITAICKTTIDTCYYVCKRSGSSQSRKRGFYSKILTTIYLLKAYIKLFLIKEYDKAFIFTRILATIKKFIKDV